MSVQRRKDSKGRVLKDGESQRKNGTYMYRFVDGNGKRQTIYAPDLQTLRDKEDYVEKQLINCADYDLGKITVQQLLEKMVALRQSQSISTRMNCEKVLKGVKGYPFMQMQIKDVKVSDAKSFILELSEGHKFSTMTNYKWFFKASFDMAIEDGILSKNPFVFNLKTILKYEPKKRYALTDTEVNIYLNYIHNNKCYARYENEFRIMLGTGLRVSELYGLTMNDIDLDNRVICVSHQLMYWPTYYKDKVWAVLPLKSKASYRYLPMSDEVYACLVDVINTRPIPEKEPVVDGYTNFIFLSKIGKHGLLCDNFILRVMKSIEKSYNKDNPDGPALPHITPHIFRHTFCTNLIMSGVNIKTVQYLMGHANADVSLDVYSHINQRDAFKDFYRVFGDNTQLNGNSSLPSHTPQLTPQLTPNLTPICVNS